MSAVVVTLSTCPKSQCSLMSEKQGRITDIGSMRRRSLTRFRWGQPLHWHGSLANALVLYCTVGVLQSQALVYNMSLIYWCGANKVKVNIIAEKVMIGTIRFTLSVHESRSIPNESACVAHALFGIHWPQRHRETDGRREGGWGEYTHTEAPAYKVHGYEVFSVMTRL